LSRSSIRQQVCTYLTDHGALDDPQGRATAKLRQALGYQGSEAGFTQLIATMDRAGEIKRQIKGKRTYQIAAVAQSSDVRGGTKKEDAGRTATTGGSQQPADLAEIDYEQLAASLLLQVVQTMSKEESRREDVGAWARRRIEKLESRNDELGRDLSHVKAELKVTAGERDEIRQQFERSESNLALLTERLAGGKERKGQGQGQLSNLLQADDRALLERLRRTASKERPGRAS
jgi:chromosome segregation ATPase